MSIKSTLDGFLLQMLLRSPREYILKQLLLGCQYGNPSRKVGGICLFYLFYFFFRVGKSLACHSPGKWCLRIERVVEMRRFLWWTQWNH